MATSEVGLLYVSKGASRFIADAVAATAATSSLNQALLSSGSGAISFSNNSKLLSGTSIGLLKSMNDTNKSVSNAVDTFNRVKNVLGIVNPPLLATATGMITVQSNTQKAGKALSLFSNDAGSASDGLDGFGGSINKVENSIRIASLGLKIFGRMFGLTNKQIQVTTKLMGKLAGGLDNISDGFGDWADEVENGADLIMDYNKEQGNQNKSLERNTGFFMNNKEAILETGLAIVKIKNIAKDADDGDGVLGKAFGGVKQLLFFKNMKTMFLRFPPPVQAAAAAVGGFMLAFAGVSAVTAVLEVFGKRAAGLTAVSESFDRLATSANLSKTFIEDFAASTDNQLTKSELLIASNKALAGSTGEFATELANSLPRLLDFARARSAATGEDVNFLFESAIQGIKKAQPLILDNLGLVVNLSEVYENYAKSLDRTADSLTGTERQQAILQDTLASAEEQIGILGEATLSNADKMAARGNMMSDMADDVSLSIQSLFGVMLGIQLTMLDWAKTGLEPVIAVIESIFQVLADTVTFLFELIRPLLEFFLSIWSAIGGAVEGFLAVFMRLWSIFVAIMTPLSGLLSFLNPISDALFLLGDAFKLIGDLIIGIIDFFGFFVTKGMAVVGMLKTIVMSPIIPFINDLGSRFSKVGETLEQTMKGLAIGFGVTTAVMINSFSSAVVTILSLVRKLAEGIASFLMGNSPPPKGPLSKIDKGGANVFAAWADGFSKVGTRPIDDVLQDVDNALGNIGKFSLEQVEGRLEQLDLAVRPFIEQLDIAKARFEAISAPAEAALSAIDRQLEKAVQALVSGDEGAKAAVQALDAQRASIAKNLDLQKQQVEFAQIELALKQGQQAEERALLNIQKRRIGVVEELEEETAATKASTSAAKAPASTGGAGGGGAEVAGEGVTDVAGEEAGTGSEFGDLIMAGFDSAINTDALSEIDAELQGIGEAGGDITEGLAGIGTKLIEPFVAFGEEVKSKFETIKTTISDWVLDVIEFFTGAGEDSLKGTLVGLFSAGSEISTGITNFFGAGGTLSTGLTGARTRVSDWATKVWNSITGIFGTEGTIGIMISGFFGEDGAWSTALLSGSAIFGGFATSVQIFISDMLGAFGLGSEDEIGFTTALENIFGEEGILSSLLASGIEMFRDFYTIVFGEEGLFANLGTVIKGLIVSPVNVGITAIVGTGNLFINWLENMINSVLENMDQTIIQNIPELLRGPLAQLEGLSISIPRLNFSIPQAKDGGLFSGGMLSVGERGQEFIGGAEKKAVFPNSFVTSIQSLEQVIMKAMSIPTSGSLASNTTNTSNNNNQTINFNQPVNPITMRQQLNMVGE